MIACTNSESFTKQGEAHEYSNTMAHIGHMFHFFGDDLMLQNHPALFFYNLITIGAKFKKLDHQQALGVDLQNTLFSQKPSHLNS